MAATKPATSLEYHWDHWDGESGQCVITTHRGTNTYDVRHAMHAWKLTVVNAAVPTTYTLSEVHSSLGTSLYCDCPQAKYRGSGCKHMIAMENLIEQPFKKKGVKMSRFQKAEKKEIKLRMALCGPPGSGKTYSALEIAKNLGGRIALIDTEHGSASKYGDLFDFDTLIMESFSPLEYVEAIREAQDSGYDIIIIDSLSHAWTGKDGALEQVDKIAKRAKSGNKFIAWGDVTPMQNEMIDTMLQCKCHLIVTMRTKMEYILETNEKGKQVPRKVGMAPVQRDGVEYEFDLVGDMDDSNTLIITKSRCPELSGAVVRKPGKDIAKKLLAWIGGKPNETPSKKPPVDGNGNGNGEPFGVKLMRRLAAVQADLVASGLCGEGDLVEIVAHAGKEYGLTANILGWPATDPTGQDVGKLVKSWIDDFQQSRKLAKAAAETGREPGCDDDEDGDIPTE